MTFIKQRTDYDFIDPKVKVDYEVLQKVHSGDITDLYGTWLTISGLSPL